jgi:hypothetical protein
MPVAETLRPGDVPECAGACNLMIRSSGHHVRRDPQTVIAARQSLVRISGSSDRNVSSPGASPTRVSYLYPLTALLLGLASPVVFVASAWVVSNNPNLVGPFAIFVPAPVVSLIAILCAHEGLRRTPRHTSGQGPGVLRW